MLQVRPAERESEDKIDSRRTTASRSWPSRHLMCSQRIAASTVQTMCSALLPPLPFLLPIRHRYIRPQCHPVSLPVGWGPRRRHRDDRLCNLSKDCREGAVAACFGGTMAAVACAISAAPSPTIVPRLCRWRMTTDCSFAAAAPRRSATTLTAS